MKKHTEQESGRNLSSNEPSKINEVEERYKFIVNAYGELMTLINREYVYEMVNDSWCLSFEKTKDDFIGKTVAEVWGEHRFKSEIKRKIDHCFNGNIFKEEDSFIIAEGRRRFYAVTYYPYRNNQGEVTHIVGVTDDITERKEAELALKKSEEELRILNEQKDKYLAIINSDLDRASSYITSILPEKINTDKLKINWKIVPSAHLGGDSFGYHRIDQEHFAIYILDVTGHGVGAALHSVSAFNTLRFENLVNTDFRYPQQVLTGLNEVFQMADHNNMFITMWYCVYCNKKNELRCAGAGHPPIVIGTPGHKPRTIASQNVMIGADQDIDFTSESFDLEGETWLYLYTDGAYEQKLQNGKMMEIEDLIAYLDKNGNKQDTEIEKLYEYLIKQDNTGSLDDDFTMIKVLFR